MKSSAASGVDQQQLRGFHSLSSVIASLEQRYLNGFEFDEEEEDAALPAAANAQDDQPAKKKQRTRNRKLKATKEEEELLLDGEGFIDDTEVADEIEEAPVAATGGGTNTMVSTAALVDLTKLVPVKTRMDTTTTTATLQSPSKPVAIVAHQTRSHFLMQYLGEFNGNAQVCEKMFALTHCIREELLDASHQFQFSAQVESLLLEVDAQYLKQQPVRSKGYLAHLLSLFPVEVTRDVLVAHLQRIVLKDKLRRQERKIEVRIKWLVDAYTKESGWKGQSRGSAYLLGEACRQAKRTRDRLEVWLVERKRELAQFSPHRGAYRLKPKPMYSTYALDRVLHHVPQLSRGELKQAMEEYPADHYFWNQAEGKYIPFKVPISAKAAAAEQAAVALQQQQPPALVSSEAAPAVTEEKKPEEDVVATAAMVKEVFAPCKGKRYQKVQFKAEDFAPKPPPPAAAAVLQ